MNIEWAILVFRVVCVVTPGVGAAEGVEAITRPSKDPTLSFVRAGRIAEVLVKKGDVVQAGQALVRQDDEAEQVQLEQLQAQAEDTTRIAAAQADLDQKKVDLKKYEEAKIKGVATDLEVQHSRLDVTIAELSLRLAHFQHKQDKRKYTEVKIQVERMTLTSPIDGTVEQILVQPGEAVDGLEDAIQIVTTDPLWIDVPVPLGEAQGIRKRQLAEIEFIDSSGSPPKGKVIHIASVADAASNTLTVRVEAANPKGRPAGEHVSVRFADSAETASSQTTNIEPVSISHIREEQGVIDGTAKE